MALGTWVVVLSFSLPTAFLMATAVSVKCGVCEKSRCPQLHYCEGKAVKDHCGCCTVCTSAKYQPHPLVLNDAASHQTEQGSACRKVKCPKFKVCMENVQGLPLCTCPGIFICKSRSRQRRPVCGSDGVTYPSRCHLRVAACNSAARIRVARKGSCLAGSATPLSGTRNCDSPSSCKKRRKMRAVCGTDGRTYMSRCHMKIAACQRGIKVRVKERGTCKRDQSSGTELSHQGQPNGDHVAHAGDSDRDSTTVDKPRAGRGGRKWRKQNGRKDATDSGDKRGKRRKQRRDKRRKKEKRRKRREKSRPKLRYGTTRYNVED